MVHNQHKVMMMGGEYAMEKAYVFLFKTKNGEVVVGTDTMKEMVQQEWFQNFLGVANNVVPVQSQKDELKQELLEEVQRLGREIQEMRRQQQEVQRQPVQQVASVPQQQRMPSSFMDVTPNLMTKQIWESLSPEQQYQWQMKYTA